MDKTYPVAGKNPDEPTRGKKVNSLGTMPTKKMQANMLTDQSPTSGRQQALHRVADDARKAAEKGPNPHEKMEGTTHGVMPQRFVGNFDNKTHPVHSIYKAKNWENKAG